MRGENRSASESAERGAGSPPRAQGILLTKDGYSCEKRNTPPHAWGILEEEHLFDGETRNTPTCVGNTLRGGAYPGKPGEHPHMRGEYT